MFVFTKRGSVGRIKGNLVRNRKKPLADKLSLYRKLDLQGGFSRMSYSWLTAAPAKVLGHFGTFSGKNRNFQNLPVGDFRDIFC